MKKKFFIKDEDGKQYTVEEEIEKKSEEQIADEPDEVSLSKEEIASLKLLAAKATDLIALLSIEKREHEEHPELTDEDVDVDVDKDEDEDDVDVDVDDADEDEEIINTKTVACDSKKSFGSIEKKKKSNIDDSIEVDAVSNAWNDRFSKILNGGNK